MSTWNSLVFMVLLQVTIITLIAGVAINLATRLAALRHAIGVLALAFVLASPALALFLPKPSWLRQNDDKVQTGLDVRSPIDTAKQSERQIVQPASEPEIIAQSMSADHGNLPEDTSKSVSSLITSKATSFWQDLAAGNFVVFLSKGVTIASWIWAIGIGISFLRYFVAQRQLGLLAKSINHATLDLAIIDQARQTVGLRAVPAIGISDLVPMPCVVGCWKPLVVLPQRLVECSSAARTREVLVHEFAHVVRRDPLVNASQHVARVIFWPHPGVRWLNSQIARAREEVCDNFVLGNTDSTEYAETLLEVAERCVTTRLGVSILGMSVDTWNLEKRIADILDPERTISIRPNRTLVVIVAMLLCAACVALGGIGLAAQVSDSTNSEQRDKKSGVADQVSNPADKEEAPKAKGLDTVLFDFKATWGDSFTMSTFMSSALHNQNLDELELTEDQLTQVRAADAKFRANSKREYEKLTGGRQMSATESVPFFRKACELVEKDFQKEIEQVLIPRQLQSLERLAIAHYFKHGNVLSFLESKWARDYFEISDVQMAKMSERLKDGLKAIKSEVGELRERADDNVLSELSEEQRGILDDYFGK